MALTRTSGVRRGDLPGGRTQAFLEAASQTFVVGDFLVINSSGQVAQAAAAGSRVGAASGLTNRIIGRAETAASGTTSNYPIDVTLAEPGTQFTLPLYSATGSTPYPNPNLIGTNYELLNYNGAGGPFYVVDMDQNTNTKIKVADISLGSYPNWPSTSNSTTQYGNVWVEFLFAQYAIGGGW